MLFIAPRFGTIHRGAEVFVHELAKRLNKDLFDVSILSFFHTVQIDGVRFIQRRTLQREALQWLEQTAVIGRLVKGRWFFSPAEIEALLLMRYSKRLFEEEQFDIIAPLGGWWTYHYARKWSGPGARIVSIGQAGPAKRYLGKSDFFVALTSLAEQEAHQLFPGIKTCVIPNGVDLKLFRPAASRRQGSGKTILSVGALAYDKRHDLLFDAVNLLPSDVRVLCVGVGPEIDRLRQHPLAQAGRVEFGNYAHRDMPDCYRSADIFSLASPNEAFGNVFIEALASGLNVVANDGMRQRFILGDAGYYCNVFDARAYANKLSEALHDHRAEQNVCRARTFRWDDVVSAYQDLFLALANQKTLKDLPKNVSLWST
jgi:glycosyltransferase involved in cell wall biosynthesis